MFTLHCRIKNTLPLVSESLAMVGWSQGVYWWPLFPCLCTATSQMSLSGIYTMEISNQCFGVFFRGWEPVVKHLQHTTAWQEFMVLKLWLFLHESDQTLLPMKAPFSLLPFFLVLWNFHMLLFLLLGYICALWSCEGGWDGAYLAKEWRFCIWPKPILTWAVELNMTKDRDFIFNREMNNISMLIM